MKNPPFPAVPESQQIKLLKNDKKPSRPVAPGDNMTELQSLFVEHIKRSVHLGFLEGGEMFVDWAREEKKERKSRYTLTQEGIEALEGRRSEENQRLLFNLAALYQELRDRGAVPEDKTNRNLAYGLSALLDAIDGLEGAKNLDKNQEDTVNEVQDKDIKERRQPAENPRMDHKTLCALFDALNKKQQTKLETLLESQPGELDKRLDAALSVQFDEKAQEPEKPDISHIPLYGGVIKDGPGIKWLERYYGNYLTTFGAPVNLLYRQDIQDHDKKLVKRIDREAPALGKGPRAFLPAKPDETNDKAKRHGIDKQGHAVEEQTEEAIRTARTLQIRKHREKRTEAPAAAHS